MGGVLHEHVATFYDRDADLVAEIAEWTAEGLDAGERVMLVATSAHLAAVDDVLLQYDVDAAAVRASGTLLTYDATHALAELVSGAGPDPSLFATRVVPIIDAATSDGRSIRIYGEMVALLWEQGDVTGALQLEALWNALASTHTFALRCGYPTSALDSSLLDAHAVCRAHSRVTAPRSYWTATTLAESDRSSGLRESDVFLPVAAAIPAARRFVATALRSWHLDRLVGDSVLVASELATNAMRHAESPFRISLHRTRDSIRIAIADVAETAPSARVAASDDAGGRGVQIVEQLAHRWGWEAASTGKVVWAELAT